MLSTEIINPRRVSMSDVPLDILRFAAQEARAGGAALATLVEIRGGSARALGSHVAVAADGRFCGYVSGGCVEAAVASEAMVAMAEGSDRVVMFGEGSPFFDIVLPCGGGITVAIHILRNPDVVEKVIERAESRLTTGLTYSMNDEALTIAECPPFRTVYRNETVDTVYRPKTRILISGQTGEAEMLRNLADVAGYDTHSLSLTIKALDIAAVIDQCSAVVLLHHDLDAEAAMLAAALQSNAFYIGALGSTRTHRKRLDRLQALNLPSEALDRIRAPIGLFGPTRDASSLALSILADIAAARLELFPC